MCHEAFARKEIQKLLQPLKPKFIKMPAIFLTFFLLQANYKTI